MLAQLRSSSKRKLLTYSAVALLITRSYAEDKVSVKWQDYSEDDDRIRVISKYVEIDKGITENLTIKAHIVNDAISGATPTGSPNEDGTVPLADMDDERNSIVTDFVYTHGIRTTSFQYARSKESDFLSVGYALSHSTEFNKRNTRLSLGVSYIDDDIFASFMPQTEHKESTDLFVGLTQVIDPNTLFTINLSHGESDGFLSDPYKTIVQNTEIAPGLFLPLTFLENRPKDRSKDILYLNTKHYFSNLRGGIDIGFRYFTDNWDVDSQTLDIEWYQSFGEKLRIAPKLRYYKQSAANFYTTNLNNAPFTASDEPSGAAPNYSADYRLAKLGTVTYGLKVIYSATDNLYFDASYERYDMSGKDNITPEAAFPDADVITLGLTYQF
jgi:hypothetical protein